MQEKGKAQNLRGDDFKNTLVYITYCISFHPVTNTKCKIDRSITESLGDLIQNSFTGEVQEEAQK